mgnify:CR=1 FL=1
MANETDWVNISVPAEARRKAQVTRAKLGLTWETFLDQAAESLDPDSTD